MGADGPVFCDCPAHKFHKGLPAGETVLLSGQKGPAYFLVPVQGDVVTEDLELRRAMAKASLRESWRIAEASGLDQLSDEAIQALARQAREARKKAAKLR